MPFMTMILLDMVRLAVEIWLTPLWLGITVVFALSYTALRAFAGTYWMVNAAVMVALISAFFILFQAGQSAWGANLMLYLLPVLIANATGLIIAFMFGFIRRVRL